jgi:hypothetical protein
MRLLARILLTTVGVVILAVGACAAWLVGPDDTVVVGETEFTGGTAYTAAGLFTMENLSVVVSAEAQEGEVFVGAAHPVDVTDVVAGHDAFRISQVSIGSLAGAPDAGEEPVPDPRGLDWFDSASGAGEQTLAYPIDGMSPQFLIYSPDGAPVTASIGFTVDGTFLVCVAVAALGALVLIGGWLLTRRRRPAKDRSQADAPADEKAAGQADDTAAGEADVQGRDGAGNPPSGAPESPRTTAGPSLRRAAVALGAGALILPLGACAALPEIPEQMAPSETTKVAVTADDVDELWADYDERNNAAIKAAGAPDYDAAAWKTADVGVLLAGDEYITTYNRADSRTDEGTKDEEEPVTLTTAGEWVSSPAFDTYPMWALVHSEVTSSADEDEDEADEGEPAKFTYAAVVVKAAADAPWKVRNRLSVPVEYVDELPEVAATPTEEQLATVDEVVDAMDAYFRTGKKPKALGDISGLEFVRSSIAEDGDEDWSKDASWSMRSALFDDSSIHVIPTDDALYAVIDHRHTSRLTFPSRNSPYWNPPADAVNGTSGSVLTRDRASTILVRIPTDGAADGRGGYLRPLIAAAR